MKVFVAKNIIGYHMIKTEKYTRTERKRQRVCRKKRQDEKVEGIENGTDV